jgi:PmbA protein
MDARSLRDRLEHARKLGARGVELLYEHRTGHEVTAVRGRLQTLEVPPHEALVVRVWLDGGRSAVRAGPPADVDGLVDGALAAAALAPEDPHAGPVSRQSPVLGGLGVFDRRYDQVTDEDRAEVVLGAERSVRQVDRRLASSGFVYRDSRRTRRFTNTRGSVLEEVDSVYEATGTVSAGTNEEIRLTDEIASRTFASIASFPYGTNLARRAVDLLQPVVALSGPVRVLLPPLAVARLFAALADGFSAENLAVPGGFFLRPLPDGAPIVDPRLHLQDDGTLPGGLRSASFDDRGVCPIPLTLLREGRVDGRFVGPELAHLHDVRPTGHEVGAGIGAGKRPRNLLLRSGTRSMNAALADLGGRVLQIDDLPDLSGLDPATGRLRVRVHGVVSEANKPIGAVRGLWLEGDLLGVLNRVVEVCSDTDRIGHVDAPGMILDGFSVA